MSVSLCAHKFPEYQKRYTGMALSTIAGNDYKPVAVCTVERILWLLDCVSDNIHFLLKSRIPSPNELIASSSSTEFRGSLVEDEVEKAGEAVFR